MKDRQTELDKKKADRQKNKRRDKRYNGQK